MSAARAVDTILPMLTLRRRLRRSERAGFVRVALVVLLAISAASAKNGMQVVVVPVANMYSKPTEKSEVVSQALYGNNVTLLVSRGEWSRIQTSDRYKGWTPSRYLRIVLSGDGYATAGPTVQVVSLFANIYAEPDVTKHKPVITVAFETKLEVAPEPADAKAKARKQKTEGWVHVRLAGMTLAWIQESDVVANPKPLTIAESIELARRFLGLPYLWGGRSSFGFDCSGFTQMLVRARGINMPRDADQQAAWSGLMAVDRKDLQPGDLLFFGSSAKDITHTGMYIGDGQFIHDSTSGHPVVQISCLDDEPWTHLLVVSRRVKQAASAAAGQ
ncbi:MAG TPA: SH3 domain-containing C40 family peptidase [Candidatus Dormibacteraeota bacterium]|nr:SH3 domain-containing C40 family peptidase [Candidatus Dormibacteraeota bacterium]